MVDYRQDTVHFPGDITTPNKPSGHSRWKAYGRWINKKLEREEIAERLKKTEDEYFNMERKGIFKTRHVPLTEGEGLALITGESTVKKGEVVSRRQPYVPTIGDLNKRVLKDLEKTVRCHGIHYNSRTGEEVGTEFWVEDGCIGVGYNSY